MNKYIRTKDGINLLRKGVDKYIVKDSDYSCEITIDKETLLKNYKLADTIEELCDEFVYIENKKPRVLDRVITREIKEKGIKVAETIYCHPNWNGIIYGAVWCEFGLKYVAKLNDRGELELL